MSWTSANAPKCPVSPADRGEFMKPKAPKRASEMVEEAYRCFGRWVAEHDPDGEMDILDQARAYSEWASKNSIAKYLDDAQGSPAVTRPHRLGEA